MYCSSWLDDFRLKTGINFKHSVLGKLSKDSASFLSLIISKLKSDSFIIYVFYLQQ